MRGLSMSSLLLSIGAAPDTRLFWQLPYGSIKMVIVERPEGSWKTEHPMTRWADPLRDALRQDLIAYRRKNEMANSGIYWIDKIFDWAVYGLVWLAKLLGITYEEINVWLFCVVWPLFTVALIVWSFSLWRKNGELRRQIDARS
jgi:hypothetical protein